MLIYVHGLGESASDWQAVSRLVGQESTCINLFDGVDDKISFDSVYQRFVAMCQCYDRVDICGLSIGAIIGLRFAMDYPDKVNKLIVIAPQYKIPKHLLSIQNKIMSLLPERVFDSWQLTKKQVIALVSSMKMIDLTRQLDNVTCQVLVVCGDRDRANKRAAQKLARLLPRATVTYVSNAGHQVNLDNPRHLSADIKEFLSD